MRPEWRQAIATQHVWEYWHATRWRMSAALESFLDAAVDADAFKREYGLWMQDRTYRDSSWDRETYRHWYLGYYGPLYISSLQRAVLQVAPLRNGNVLRVLDVGVGTGTTALALVDFANTCELLGLAPVSVELTCLEKDPRKVQISREHLAALAEHLEPRTAEMARELAENGQRWLVGDLAEADSLGLEDGDYGLVTLGNVVRELERLPDPAARESIFQQLLPRCLVDGGVVLMTQHGFQNGAEEYVQAVCDFKCEMQRHGLAFLGPGEADCECGAPAVDECCSVQRFMLEWPEYFSSLTGEAPCWTVRSIWVAGRWTGPVGSALRTGLGLGELLPLHVRRTETLPFACPVCGRGTQICEGPDGTPFVGCRDYCADEGSVTGLDGTTRDPIDVGRTRENKSALTAAHLEAARCDEERRRREEARRRDADAKERVQEERAAADSLGSFLGDSEAKLADRVVALLAADPFLLGQVSTPVLQNLYGELDSADLEAQLRIIDAFGRNVIRLRQLTTRIEGIRAVRVLREIASQSGDRCAHAASIQLAQLGLG